MSEPHTFVDAKTREAFCSMCEKREPLVVGITVSEFARRLQRFALDHEKCRKTGG